MKYIVCLLVCVSACVGSGEINDPRTYAGDGEACDTRQYAHAEVVARLGLDESVCEAVGPDADVCADYAMAYAPYMTGTSVRVSRRPAPGGWAMVCSCAGCSDELGFDPGTWPARIREAGTVQTWLF